MPSSNISLLFKRIAQGDHLAYEQVFELFADSIYTVAFAYGRNHELAEDAVQQVFLKLWERRGNLDGVHDPEAWLHTAARYQMIDMLDKEFTRIRHLRAAGQAVVFQESPATEKMIDDERMKVIRDAVEKLPPKQREIYHLVREEGLPYAEIGNRMGLSRETIKDYMSQALKSLRATLSKQKNRLFILFLLLVKNIF